MVTSKPVRRPARASAGRSTRQAAQEDAKRSSKRLEAELSEEPTVEPAQQPTIQLTRKPTRPAHRSTLRKSMQQSATTSTRELTKPPTQESLATTTAAPPTMYYFNNTPPIQPLTIEEATQFTTTRIPPIHTFEPILQYIFPTVSPLKTNNLALQHPQHFIFLPSQNTQPFPLTANTHFYNRNSRSKVPSQPRPLPKATPPPLYTQRRLQSIPIEHANRIELHRAYAMIYLHLERNGGWIWWEMDYVDIRKMEEELFEKEEVVGDEDTTMGEVLGEEEEEIPEHEMIRAEKRKRIAAVFARHLMLKTGLIE